MVLCHSVKVGSVVVFTQPLLYAKELFFALTWSRDAKTSGTSTRATIVELSKHLVSTVVLVLAMFNGVAHFALRLHTPIK